MEDSSQREYSVDQSDKTSWFLSNITDSIFVTLFLTVSIMSSLQPLSPPMSSRTTPPPPPPIPPQTHTHITATTSTSATSAIATTTIATTTTSPLPPSLPTNQKGQKKKLLKSVAEKKGKCFLGYCSHQDTILRHRFVLHDG